MNAQHDRCCPSLGLSPLEILAACLAKAAPAPDWPHFAGRRVTLTESCRTAIELLRIALGLNEGDEILVSAYNCGTEVDALLASGLQVRCVDCDPMGMLTLETLQEAVTARTRALYIIHPFGWPQPLGEIDAWRREQGLLLIEDCALALFSSSADGSPIGSTGDASVFSLPKSLPVPDGGAISWTTGWRGPGELRGPPLGRTLRRLASLSKAWVRRQQLTPKKEPASAPLSQSLPAARMGDMPANYYFEAWRAGRAPSRLTLRMLGNVDPAAIRERRRRNYRLLAAALEEGGVSFLFPRLSDGVCPLSCPVLVDERDEIVPALKQLGIETSPWWAGGHRLIDWDAYPVARNLKRCILPLPVHHQLDDTDMEYIWRIVRSLCGRREYSCVKL